MYDYIIVGAGSAGCVLAHRLSEDPSVSILLLEAGGPDDKREFHIPAAFVTLFQSEYDWNYHTEPQPHLNQRQLYWPRGKVLGGSSSINAMIYIRGNQADYDHWAALGNETWGFVDVLPYFKRAQNQIWGESAYHGVGGPLNVASLRDPNPLSQAFIQAGEALGLPHNPDFNGPTQPGVGFYQVTQKNGRRHSSATAYLHPIIDRPNLIVKTHAQVLTLTFQGRQATGLAYHHQGQIQQVQANKEIILCGGAINSPQLLLLSGVGPAEDLRALDIPVMVDLPGVGQNLQDHLMVGVPYTATKPISLTNARKNRSFLKYYLWRKGSLTSNIAEAGGFITTDEQTELPNLQFHFTPVCFTQHGLTQSEQHGFTIGPTLIRPQSRGFLTLRSRDPFVPIAIQPNYCAEPPDLEVLVNGVRWARHLAQTSAFAPYRGTALLPGTASDDDKVLQSFVRAYAETLYHPVGTCKMGIDPLAVVDPHLRVYGLDGLRVVDASVMPTIISGNTHAPTVMIAEKAADLLYHDR